MGNSPSACDAGSPRDLAHREGAPLKQPMSAITISRGLTEVAEILHSRMQNISIVVVGGTVNTLLLHTRESTGDVNFFYSTKRQHPDVTRVIAAATSTANKLGLGKGWFNNHTALFIEEGTIRQVYDQAVAQNEIVFRAPGLTVYAAPWQYALSTKLNRMSKKGRKDYDVKDAASYLKQLIVQRGGKAVRKSELEAWARQYKFTVPTDEAIKLLKIEYKIMTRKDGVISSV